MSEWVERVRFFASIAVEAAAECWRDFGQYLGEKIDRWYEDQWPEQTGEEE